MPKEPTRSPLDKPQVLATDVVQFKPVVKAIGRPKKLGAPPVPNFVMSADEATVYTYFIQAFQEDYPGMRNSDLLMLPLVAAEYIKYLRLVGKELESGELVTMSRQHPGSMLARFMSQVLATTRQQRVKNEKPEEDESDSWWKQMSAS